MIANSTSLAGNAIACYYQRYLVACEKIGIVHVDHACYRSRRMPAEIDYRKSQARDTRDIDRTHRYDTKSGVTSPVNKK
jgi:hypothetical protein